MTYYNELDPHAADWLEGLISAGLISGGRVDRRDVRSVKPDDLEDSEVCHFFAGIGGWDYALKLAGWTGPVWTASLPCQPFSAAGRQKGEEDERHLWPAFRSLIKKCKPPVVFGEQVASRLGREWLARVRSDLEALGYAVGAADLCAASSGAPHIRQRLYWMAHSGGKRVRGTGQSQGRGAAQGVSGAARKRQWIRPNVGPACPSKPLGVVNPDSAGPQGLLQRGDGADERPSGAAGLAGGLGDASGQPRQRQPGGFSPAEGRVGGEGEQDGGRYDGPPDAGAGLGAWGDYELLYCKDGKLRRTQSGLFPLASRVPFRLADGRTRNVSRAKVLRGIGNAIVPAVAARFVRAVMAVIE